MTIFDSIKYPLSCPVKQGELGAVPAEIYDAWFNKVYPGIGSSNRPTYQEKINMLRKMIAEWDT